MRKQWEPGPSLEGEGPRDEPKYDRKAKHDHELKWNSANHSDLVTAYDVLWECILIPSCQRNWVSDLKLKLQCQFDNVMTFTSSF